MAERNETNKKSSTKYFTEDEHFINTNLNEKKWV